MKHADIKKLNFVKRICLSISGILLCLSSLGFSSFALFTNSSSSLANSVVSASYNLFVDIDGSAFPTDTAIFLGEGTYTVTLTRAVGQKATGFGIVNINGKTYYTKQIDEAPLTFTLTLAEPSEIVFSSHWGKSENYNNITENGQNLISQGDF